MRKPEVPRLDSGGPSDLAYAGYDDEWLDRPVYQRFQQVATSAPEATAICDRSGQISYGDLLEATLRLGRHIDSLVQPGDPVAIALPVGRQFPMAMLAALAAGRPYVPLDLNHPAERLRHIIHHSGAMHVLTDAAHSTDVSAWLPTGAELLLIDHVSDLRGDSVWRPTGGPDSIAYIIYTSGSSGMPKGVYQNQRGLTHDVQQYTRSIHIRSDDVLTGLYSPGVNGSIRDIYGALLNGAELLLIDLKSDGLNFAADAIKRQGATVFHAMPPVMRSVLRAIDGVTGFASVRLVYLAGDRLLASDLATLRKYLAPGTFVYVGIGSTECATLYRQWFVPAEFIPQGPLVPSGYAIPDRIVEIRDTDGRPVPAGEIGQIFVSSPYLSRGYWRDEARTRVQYEPIPDQQGWVRFATGDLGVISGDGCLVFEGRADRQVKIRGYRVEPAEVEVVLREHPGVSEAAVIAIHGNDQTRLAAFVVAEADVLVGELEARVRQILPSHLWPAEIRKLPQLPLLGNFKIDANALQMMIAPPVGEMQSQAKDIVTRCWCSALRVSEAEHGRSFAECGGDSLKALEFHLALERGLHRNLPLSRLGLNATLGDVIRWIDELPQEPPSFPAVKKLQMFIFPPAGGVEANTFELRDALSEDMRISVIDIPQAAKKRAYEASIEDLASQLLAEVLQNFQDGHQTVFLGQCYGGRVAHAVAALLQEQGIRIDLLVIADAALSADHGQEPRQGMVRSAIRRMRLSVFRRLPRSILRNWKESYADVRDRSGMMARVGYWSHEALRLQHSREWRPRLLNSSGLLLLSGDTLQRTAGVASDLGWKPVFSSLEVIPFGQGHLDYTRKPLSAALTGIILASL